ncbi:hypothetical protein KIW84_021832 [Lathyrus oleraceus]|uniref:Uncharacterized protein n=1 Tax=Pisum sativum TaxID=3888 RepID=A0A9D5B9X2_PEA|nr:hypothetical protein KIW84_021832 [Pisum sativum]
MKDVQRDIICADLVKQIKDAEAATERYSQELHSLRMEEHDLKKQVEVIEGEKKNSSSNDQPASGGILLYKSGNFSTPTEPAFLSINPETGAATPPDAIDTVYFFTSKVNIQYQNQHFNFNPTKKSKPASNSEERKARIGLMEGIDLSPVECRK